MKSVAIILAAMTALLLGGCATRVFTTPVTTAAAPGAIFKGDAGFAFFPEQNMRKEKQEFYRRAKEYITKVGFKYSETSEPEYLIQFVFLDRQKNPLGFPEHGLMPHVAWPAEDAHLTWMTVFVYRTADRRKLTPASFMDLPTMIRWNIWSAAISVPPDELRANEEEYIVGIFSHFGKSYNGSITVRKEANQQPLQTPGSGTPAAHAPVAPPPGAAGL
jgi:hypothetical protein